MTHTQQQAALRKQIAAFIRNQRAATAALREITAIALCETEGNPLDSALRGEESILRYAGMSTDLGLYEAIEDATGAINAAGHVV